MELKEFYNQLIMYYEIHRFKEEEGFSISRIAEHLRMNFRTVKKYLKMSPKEFEEFLQNKSERRRLLACYEPFVVDRLREFQETSAAQMHDWLKEHHSDFPQVPSRTVFNFVMWVRQKYDLPKSTLACRQFEEVIELPLGEQSQVDFGQTSLRRTDGGRKKIYFFTMVLSASRMKFVFLQTEPFTAYSAILAHEKSFAFLGGIPRKIVYDQDAVFLTDENIGDLVLVGLFRRYVESRPFKTHFCRKEDPQSKGKVENVVKYVKQNFLFNRPFSTIEALNRDALAWLDRTGNGQEHQKTHRIPKLVWQEEERSTLQPYVPIPGLGEPLNGHKVLKTNVLLYRGNTYSLPFGYYQGEDTVVLLKEKDGTLLLYDTGNRLIASHQIPEGKGLQVFNTDHRRDKTEAMNVLKNKFRTFFEDHPLAEGYVDELAAKYPRYLRDQLLAILKESGKAGIVNAVQALEYCVDNHIIGANDFKSVLDKFEVLKEAAPGPTPVRMMDPEASVLATIQPAKSSIETYESILKNYRS